MTQRFDYKHAIAFSMAAFVLFYAGPTFAQGCADYAKVMVELERQNMSRERPLSGPGWYWVAPVLQQESGEVDWDRVYQEYLKQCKSSIGDGAAAARIEIDVKKRQESMAKAPDRDPTLVISSSPEPNPKKCSECKATLVKMLAEAPKIQADLILKQQRLDLVKRTLNDWLDIAVRLPQIFGPLEGNRAENDPYYKGMAERLQAAVKETETDISNLRQRQDNIVGQVKELRHTMESLHCNEIP